MKKRSIYKKLIEFFLQGLLILAPITITFWAIMALFNFIDGILPNFLFGLIPNLMTDTQGNVRHITGLGFIVVIVLVVSVGYISSNFIFSKAVDGFDRLLEKTPGIKFIYSTLKDFFEAFAGEKKKFTQNVLANEIVLPEVLLDSLIRQAQTTDLDDTVKIAAWLNYCDFFVDHNQAETKSEECKNSINYVN